MQKSHLFPLADAVVVCASVLDMVVVVVVVVVVFVEGGGDEAEE